ncbi:MAG: pyridoxamine 5'-phosphate oxidase family protein [Dehalococcoidia bacterium]|nr:pyridoxamine 5'-phosphate oxidase family protein [Dehalococcoidia bacterium]
MARSPFVLIGSADAEGNQDVSPKGDPAGFVQVLDSNTLAIPDRPGNRRGDTFSNVLQNPRVALFFLVPGVRETLRVQGTAHIVRDEWLREQNGGQRASSGAGARGGCRGSVHALCEVRGAVTPVGHRRVARPGIGAAPGRGDRRPEGAEHEQGRAGRSAGEGRAGAAVRSGAPGSRKARQLPGGPSLW